MLDYGHFIGGKHGEGHERPHGRRVRAHDRGSARQGGARFQGRGGRRRRERQGRAAGLGRDQSAAARPRADEVPRARQPRLRQDRRRSRARARQDRRRRQGRPAARPRSGRVRHRHPASAEGRVHGRRRPRHRSLFHAPAARRRGRHHAVQLSGHDPAVEVRTRDRLRQRLHPQAVRARPRRADAAGGAVHGSGTAGRHPQRRQRRQGSGRRDPRPSRHRGHRLRRLDADRRIHLRARLRRGQARAVLRRRQEPHDRHARCRHGPGGRCADRRGLRLGGRALHGGFGGGAGGPEDRRPAGGEADPARGEPEDRAIHGGRCGLRPAGHGSTPQEGEGLRRHSASRKAPS